MAVVGGVEVASIDLGGTMIQDRKVNVSQGTLFSVSQEDSDSPILSPLLYTSFSVAIAQHTHVESHMNQQSTAGNSGSEFGAKPYLYCMNNA